MATLWRNRDFLKLWTGQTVSEIGSRITREGLPLTAILALGAAPWQLGILSALGGASTLAFGLVAGVWVDRLRCRPILIATDLARALLLFSIPAAALTHSLGMTQIYLAAALAGILTVFFDVAYQSYLPALVAPDQIVEGNTKLMLSATAAEIVGPGITGVLVQWITAPIAILFDALSFLVSALSVALIRHPEPARLPQPQQHWRDETVSGLRFIAGHPLLRPLASWSVTFFLFMGVFGSLYMLYAIRVLGLPTSLLGITIAMGGAGATVGSFASARVVRRFGFGPTIILAAFVIALATALIPFAHGSPSATVPILMAQQFFGDAGFAVFMIQSNSLRQTVTPAEVLGRVTAGMNLLWRGIFPVGALAGGMLGNAIGIRQTMALAVAGMVVSNAWLVWSPLRRRVGMIEG